MKHRSRKIGKQSHQQRAAALNVLGGNREALFSVVASPALTLGGASLAMRRNHCLTCGTQFAAQASIAPFCVTCGSDHVEEDPSTDALPVEVLDENQDLAGVHCAGCGQHNIFSRLVAASLGGRAHCVSCGESMDYEPPTDDLGAIAADNDLFVDPDAYVLPEPDEVPLGEVSASVTRRQQRQQQRAAKVDGTDEDLAPRQDADNAGARTVPVAPPTNTVPEFADADVIETPMTDIIDEQGEFEVTPADGPDDEMWALQDGVPLARLIMANAGTFQGQRYGKVGHVHAIQAAVKADGRARALATFGFVPIMARLPIKTMVERRVSAALASASKTVTASVDTRQNVFQQSLIMAMAGLNKGTYGGDNPLKAALFAELSSLGIRNPAQVVDKVFRASGGAYCQKLLATASELAGRSDEARNTLASVIDTAPYQEAAGDDDEDDAGGPPDGDDDDASVQARMSQQAGLRVVTASVPTPSASGGGAIRSILGTTPLFGVSRR